MSYENTYLSAREGGDQKGHYHNLGAEVMSQIPEKMENPLAIIRQANGRIAMVLPLTDKKGKSVYAVIELSAMKDIDGKNSAYNLMISAFGAGSNYISNQVNGKGNTVIKNELPEEASQVNPQRIKLPGTVNEESSGRRISIPQSDSSVNPQQQNEEVQSDQPTAQPSPLEAKGPEQLAEVTEGAEGVANTEAAEQTNEEMGATAPVPPSKRTIVVTVTPTLPQTMYHSPIPLSIPSNRTGRHRATSRQLSPPRWKPEGQSSSQK